MEGLKIVGHGKKYKVEKVSVSRSHRENEVCECLGSICIKCVKLRVGEMKYVTSFLISSSSEFKYNMISKVIKSITLDLLKVLVVDRVSASS